MFFFPNQDFFLVIKPGETNDVFERAGLGKKTKKRWEKTKKTSVEERNQNTKKTTYHLWESGAARSCLGQAGAWSSPLWAGAEFALVPAWIKKWEDEVQKGTWSGGREDEEDDGTPEPNVCGCFVGVQDLTPNCFHPCLGRLGERWVYDPTVGSLLGTTVFANIRFRGLKNTNKGIEL